ncbi:MAG TPA: glycosyltransferase [Acetobacteraceae bacterium]|jgi:glycosyltransferase involved in cell wall biosynthesis|nr:glycosyltransferase [Acetobacteraceae bacterium]
MTIYQDRRRLRHYTAPIVPSSLPQRRLNVLVYLNDLRGGGAERQCLAIMRDFQAKDIVVKLVVHQLRGELVDQIPPGVDVVDLKCLRTRECIVPLARHIRQNAPDILLTNVDHMNIAGTLARVLSRAATKVVIIQHNPLLRDFTVEGQQFRLIAPMYRVLAPFIDAAIAVSDGIARELVTRGGIAKKKVFRIYNAVVFPDFEERAGMSVTHPWFVERTSPVFVTAMRLEPQKDPETLIRAMALYRQNGGQGRLLVLGTGSLRESAEDLVHQLNIENAIDFVGFQANPLPWFRNADLFVLSSRNEGFGIALAEAMGCGTRVISTDCGHGPREILAGGKYGVLVPPGDPAALAAALDRADEICRRFMPEALKARAAEFTNKACSDAYMDVFSRLVPCTTVRAIEI